MKKITFLLIALFSAFYVNSQEVVEVKGVGNDRDGAIQDALRSAVAQVCGTKISSVTQMDNFIVMRDAVATQSSGWIQKYDVLKETPLSETYEVLIKAVVSTDALEQDIKTLSQWLGGLQFLVFYDPREIPSEQLAYYEYAYDRMNEKLKEKEYKYIEKTLFKTMVEKKEIAEVAAQDNQYSYVQRLGESTKAEFTALIKSIDIRSGTDEGHGGGYKVVVNLTAYDNCTADGFFPAVMESGWKNLPNKDAAIKAAITEAIDNGFDRFIYQFNKYMGDWLNNGASFELRFVNMGTPRTLRGLIAAMKADAAFGGELQPYQEANFIQLRCNFKKKPYDMYDAVLNMADQIEEIKVMQIDASKQYGRLIVFEPTK